jgi:hypothetical protein
MSSKIINLVAICLFSLCIAGNANAGLIIDEVYTDYDGIEWQYIGSFDTNGGVVWNNANGDSVFDDFATPLNGLEAAAIIFGGDASQYAISVLFPAPSVPNGPTPTDVDSSSHVWVGSVGPKAEIAKGAAIVSNEAWYATHSGGVTIKAEGITADLNGDGLYSTAGDMSAYVNDRLDARTNYVFKAVSTPVPEPSTLAIFSLALIGLASRRIKNNK